MQTSDGLDHDSLTVGPHDHHPQPVSVSFSNTSQSLPPGTTFNLDVTLPDGNYTFAKAMLLGARQTSPSSGTWRESAIVMATRSAAEAISESIREAQFKKVYLATYSKAVGDSYLSHKIFDSNTGISNRYIALQDAVLVGSVLRLTFRNFFGGSATLWVKGQALAW